MIQTTDTKQLTYEEFKIRFIDNKESFCFKLENLSFRFFYHEPLFFLVISDNYKDKVISFKDGSKINMFKFNSIPIKEFWNKLKIVS